METVEKSASQTSEKVWYMAYKANLGGISHDGYMFQVGDKFSMASAIEHVAKGIGIGFRTIVPVFIYECDQQMKHEMVVAMHAAHAMEQEVAIKKAEAAAAKAKTLVESKEPTPAAIETAPVESAPIEAPQTEQAPAEQPQV